MRRLGEPILAQKVTILPGSLGGVGAAWKAESRRDLVAEKVGLAGPSRSQDPPHVGPTPQSGVDLFVDFSKRGLLEGGRYRRACLGADWLGGTI